MHREMGSLCLLACLSFLACLSSVLSKELNILNFGAQPSTEQAGFTNAAAISFACGNATAGDSVLVPEGTFYSLGGISATGLRNVTIVIKGTLVALPDYDHWPRTDSRYENFIDFTSCSFLTITGGGLVDGRGKGWWDKTVLPEIFGKLPAKRPKLLTVEESTDVLVENLHLHNSPSFHLLLSDVARVEVRFITVTVDREKQWELKSKMSSRRTSSSAGLQPEDLNTDGIDPSGQDIYIHDCQILNDDDSIAVKPCSQKCVNAQCSRNILLENLILTGFGASIGSVPPTETLNCVQNITFRNISMPKTGKGIYIKSNPSCAANKSSVIADILYEDILITEPRWWAIWIGPQQQHEPNKELGEKCALSYPIDNHCPTQGCVDFRNITLRNVHVERPLLSPGVILGNATNPMRNIIFDNVTVTHPGEVPFGRSYKCEHADVIVTGGTTPAPVCG